MNCFFRRVACGKVWKNLSNLRPFDSEKSHHFKSICPAYYLWSSCLTLSKNLVIWISKINLKLSWLIRMKYTPSYCTKRNRSMVSRITWNVFFVHWVVREKYMLSSYFASHNSKTSPPAYVSIAPWRDGPFPAILQVMWHLEVSGEVGPAEKSAPEKSAPGELGPISRRTRPRPRGELGPGEVGPRRTRPNQPENSAPSAGELGPLQPENSAPLLENSAPQCGSLTWLDIFMCFLFFVRSWLSCGTS